MKEKMAGMARLMHDVRGTHPLVHCITNYVTVTDCANALLAVGASPVMADDLGEVTEIVSLANALVLNIGTLNQRTVQAMFEAGRQAAILGRPVILDPVGAGASSLRTKIALGLMREIPLAVIRGNVSEIKALMGGAGTTRGVDADARDWSDGGVAQVAVWTQSLARQTGAVVAVTGATDVVSDGHRTLAVRNGHPMLTTITGSGCMLSALTGAFCGVAPDRLLEAAVAALCVMGLAGERAAARTNEAGQGTGHFHLHLMDALSVMDEASLREGMRVEQLA